MKKLVKIIISVVLITTLINIDVDESRPATAASDVGICDQITASDGHEDRCGDGQITFVNNSFEEPWYTSYDHYTNLPADEMPGWETTNGKQIVEVWSSPFAASYTGRGCQDGDKCVEINANEPAALYQDFEVKPGQFIYYSFWHMGRGNSGETLELRMGKPNNAAGNKLNPTTKGVEDRVLESTAWRGVWEQRYGYYQVPTDYASDGNSTLRIAFLSTTNSSMGNIIDNIEFYTVSVYDNEIAINEPSGGIVDPETDEFEVSNTLKYFDRDVLSSEKSILTNTLSDNVELVPGSLTIEGNAHSNYTYVDNVLTITNLPEVYEDVNVEYKVRLKTSQNVADIQITSNLDYASSIVVKDFPNGYTMFYAKDSTNLNVSYNTEGYCSNITANNGYSSDCDVATNIVYDNDIAIIDNQPTQPLGKKTFTIKNILDNLNTDKEFDEATTTLKYDYSSNMKIDFSTLKINGVAHADYTNTTGVKTSVLNINNIPDYGIEDYEITFDVKYDFDAPKLRDITVSQFLITSTLNYKNLESDSYVSDKTHTNLSYSTNIKLTSSLTDATGNSLIEPGEVLTSTITVYNDSAMTLNNIKVDLITDSNLLKDSISNLEIKNGTTLLVEGVDYTISNHIVTILKLDSEATLTFKYDLTVVDQISSSTPLNNTVSASATEFTKGAYILQTMNIDEKAASKIEFSATVVEPKNGVAGRDEDLNYTFVISNTGGYSIKKLELSKLFGGGLLDSGVKNLKIVDSDGNNVSSYTFSSGKLTISKALAPGKSYTVTVTANTISDLGTSTEIANTFDVIPTTESGIVLSTASTSTTIEVSKRPVITVPEFTTVNVGESFNLLSYASATDSEDGNISGSLTYTPAIDTSVPGIHKITVTVADSDNRPANKTMIVVVDDGNVAYGENRILYAKDFSNYVSQVVVSNSAVKIDATVKVYDKKTGNVSNDNVSVNLGSYAAKAGVYPITFTVDSEPTTKRTINATVLAGKAPEIKGATFVEVPKGGTFNPTTGVTSTDDLDGNLTSKIVVSGTYDLNTAGIYPLTYTVTDSDKNTTTVKRILLVNDGSYKAGNVYIINAKSFTKRVSEVVVTDNAIILASNTKVYDKQTGALVTAQKKVNTGSYTNVVGDYNINISLVADSAASIDVVGKVVSGDNPTLTVPKFKEIKVNDKFDVKTGVSANDTEDGDLSLYVGAVSTVDTKKAGIYKVDYSITDSDGNTTTAKQVVLVNDGSYVAGDTKIIKASDFYILTTNVDTSDAAIISSAKAKAYDIDTGLESSETLIVSSNGYSSTIGTYDITFTIASDSNVSKTIKADVSNGYNPVINAPSFVELPVGSEFDPMYGITATDTEDGTLTSEITYSPEVDTTTAGIKNIVYTVKDSTGNITTLKTIILVNDGNYFAGSSEIIYAEDFTKLVTEVDMADSAIIADASAETFSKTTGETLDFTNISVNKGSYDAVIGEYDITFTSTVDSEATITKKGTVSKGKAPVITVDAFGEINVGDEFIALDYATAYDEESGDISNSISFVSNVDPSTPGFYSVEYTVEDNEGNKDSNKMIVLVNDGNYQVGKFYVIYAKDFTKRVSEVDGSEAQAKSFASTAVYDKKTGKAVTRDVTTNLGSYTNVAGEYDVTFKVFDDATATITILATVSSGEVPTITGDVVTEVPLNGTFDAKSTMNISDEEDGDITAYGKVEGKVNTSVPAIYKLVYYITDSDGNYVEFNRYVIVNDGTYVITDKYVVRAHDFVLRVSEVDTSINGVNNATEFAVFDIEKEEEVFLDYELNIGNYRQEVGQYKITYHVYTDDEIIKAEVVADVIGGNVPEINTVQYVEIDPGDSFDPYADVEAFDIEDGDITSTLDVVSTVDTSKIGVYTVTYSVIDKDNNQTKFTKVVVVGKEEHTEGDVGIVYAESFENYVSEVDASNEGIKRDSNFKVYSKATGELVETKIVANIDTNYTNVIGEYPITYTFDVDPALKHTITGTVIGGTIPTITGENIIKVPVGESFNVADYITANDEEDGDITSKVVISNNFNPNVHGVYAVEYSVIDKDGNVSTFKQTIIVDDGYYEIVGSYIVHKKDFVINSSDVTINKDDVIRLSEFAVYNLDGTVVNNSEIDIDYNGYSKNAGSYDIKFTIGGEEVTVSATVKETIVDKLEKTGYVNYMWLTLILLVAVVIYRKKKITI